jgi:peptidoglycan/xylan/chitin deacetylase (PgdA/CDA1 family)
MSDQESKAGYPIVLYHGVTSTQSDGIENFSGKHICVDIFESQMKYIKTQMHAISLRTMSDALMSNTPLPPGSVAITFDDSYKNIHSNALPILKKYAIPATFFLPTSFIGTNKRYWTDVLEHMINTTSVKTFEVDLLGEKRVYDVIGYDQKRQTVIDIKTFIKDNPDTDPQWIMSNLKAKLGVYDSGNGVKNYENLSWIEVLKLDDPPLFEIGGHSVNHEILSYLCQEKLSNEIVSCLDTLNEKLGHTVDLFSYPEGQEKHFNETVIKTLKKAGIKICPTAINGINYPGTDRFYLKRVMVGFMGIEFP